MPKEKASLPLWGLPPFQGETSMISCTEGNGCEPKEKAPARRAEAGNVKRRPIFFSDNGNQDRFRSESEEGKD